MITSVPNKILSNKINGVAIDSPPVNLYHYREYTSEELTNLLSFYFESVEIFYQSCSLDTMVYFYSQIAFNLLWRNPSIRCGNWLRRIISKRKIDQTNNFFPQPKYEIFDKDPGDDFTLIFIAKCQGFKKLRIK